MTDVLTAEQRRLNMSRIRARDTAPEMLVRRGLHARGFRFRVHDGRLPGRPDLVLRRYNTVVFIHGCFWHGHGCTNSKLPATRTAFWRRKIEGNAGRDARCEHALLIGGWRVVVIWECALRRRPAPVTSAVIERTARWIRNGSGRALAIGAARSVVNGEDARVRRRSRVRLDKRASVQYAAAPVVRTPQRYPGMTNRHGQG